MDIIVDIDGTLADCTHRLRHIQSEPKDWNAFFEACGDDAPIHTVINMVRGLARVSPNRVVFCTGRPERTRHKTVAWLSDWLDWDRAAIDIYMRPDETHAPDNVVKRKILEKIRADGFNPVLAIEDRQQVVDMWRSEGLVCAQVAVGDF